MDATAQKALIKKLSVKTNFDPNYTQENCAWFAGKVISALISQGVPDSQVEQNAFSVLSKCKGIVKTKKTFGLALDLTGTGSLEETTDNQRRVEILYGVISEDLRFADGTGTDFASKFLDFIAARRYRAVTRMESFVNDNDEKGYFRYPDACVPPGYLISPMQLNVDAQAYWQPVHPPNPVPEKVKPDQATGTANPLASIQNVWHSKKAACEGNLLDCEATMSCVLMDSLLEAKNSDSLLKAMYAKSDSYLRICFITRDHETHFLNDTSSSAMFIQNHIDPNDLQVGDHVYVWNHPIYSALSPGNWSGEHALVTLCGTRQFDDGKGFVVTGHGVEPTTLLELRDRLGKQINTLLNRVYAQAKIFLAFKAAGDTAPANATVTFQDNDLTYDGKTVHARIYLFQMNYEFQDYSLTPLGMTSPITRKRPGFLVVFDRIGKGNFLLPFLAQSIADVIAGGAAQQGTAILKSETQAPGQPDFDPVLWTIPYIDRTANPTTQYYRLFLKVKNKVTFAFFDNSKMPNPPFGRVDPNAKGVFVTRPRINFDTAYQSFLGANGAI
jgi:hypothetical protein